MESQRVRFEVALVTKLRAEGGVTGGVRPETDRAIGRTCGNQLLLGAYVEAVDLLRMERRNEMLVFLIIVRAFCVELRHLHDLVVGRRENDCIFTRAERDRLDSLNVDVLVDEA